MGEPSNPSFLWVRDFWTWPFIFIFGGPKIPQIIQEIHNQFSQILFLKISDVVRRTFWTCWKNGFRTMMKIRLGKSLKSWIRNQYNPTNMKWNVGDYVWNFETLQPRNSETLKLWNKETKKSRNQATKKIRHLFMFK